MLVNFFRSEWSLICPGLLLLVACLFGVGDQPTTATETAGVWIAVGVAICWFSAGAWLRWRSRERACNIKLGASDPETRR